MKATHKVAAVGGFVGLLLSPSFVDYQQSPEKRKEIVAYYSATLVLLYFGLLSTNGNVGRRK